MAIARTVELGAGKTGPHVENESGIDLSSAAGANRMQCEFMGGEHDTEHDTEMDEQSFLQSAPHYCAK